MQTKPADGATGVMRDVIIKVTFNTSARPSTVNTSTFLVKDSMGNSVSGTVLYADKVATFTPASKLALSRGYTVTLTKGIKDLLGFAMAEEYSFDLTTRDGAWGLARWIGWHTGDLGVDNIHPQIAVNNDGDAMVIWEQYATQRKIWSNNYSPSEGWGTAQLLDSFSNIIYYPEDYPQVGIDAAGNAVAVWHTNDDTLDYIWSGSYTQSGGWGTPYLIDTSARTYQKIPVPKIAVNAAGIAIAVWDQYDGVSSNIWSNRYNPSEGWGTPQMINAGAESTGSPQIVVDTAGNAIAVWDQYDGVHSSIWSNRYTQIGGWGTAQLIETDDSGNAYSPKIAINAAGNAMAVWEQHDGTHTSICSNRYAQGEGWGIAQLIDTDSDWTYYPQVAIGADGNAMAMWIQDGITEYLIKSSRNINGEGWGTAQKIVTQYNNWSELYPQIAVDAVGNAFAVWEQHDGTRPVIWSNRYTPSTGWGTAHLLAIDIVGEARYPQVAVDASGNGLMVWSQDVDGLGRGVMSKRFE